MGFNRDVIRRRVDEMHTMGVRVRWAGRRPRLWRSVIRELEIAEEKTRHNDVLNLTMCVNYGGRAEIVDAVREIARLAAEGRINPGKVDERMIARYLDEPDMPDVDLFVRSSGEQRTSNFLLWQSAYAEMVFLDTLFPDFDRRHLWQAVEIYARRDRRFGGALDKPRRLMNEMLDVARTALERYHDVAVDDDGTLTFAHGGVVCAVQGTELDEGLPVINLTCVVAWDLPGKGRRADAGRDGRRGRAVRHPPGDPR